MSESKTLSVPGGAAVGCSAWLSLASATFNIGIPIASWFAVNGHAPAGNIVKLLAAATALMSPLVLLVLLKPGDPVPRWREWSSHVSDVITISILVWHGWLWCSLAFTIGWFGCIVLFTTKRAAARLNDLLCDGGPQSVKCNPDCEPAVRSS